MPENQKTELDVEDQELLEYLITMYTGLANARKHAGISEEQVKKSAEKNKSTAQTTPPTRAANLSHIDESPAMTALYDRLQTVVHHQQDPEDALDLEPLLKAVIEELDPPVNGTAEMEKTDLV
ncbi:hypothetical protein ACHAPT_012946 [Fusarium lateritium]